MGAAYKSSSEKGRQAGEPGAKAMGIDGRAEYARTNRPNTNSDDNARGLNTGKFQGSTPRKIHGIGTRNFPGGGFRNPLSRMPVFELTTADWNEITAQAFRDYMREEGISVKELAQQIGCSDRTAENYVAGRNAPAGVQHLRCVATIPQFDAAVREVTGQATGFDAMAQHRAMKLMQEASRFLDAVGGGRPGFEEMPDEAAIDAGEVDTLTGDLFEHCAGSA